MADDVKLSLGSEDGATVATDDIGGKHYQRVKLVHGGDGVNAGDVEVANGFPVQVVGSVDAGNSTASTLLASGTFNGTGLDVSKYASISVFVDTNVDGTLSLQWSVDGTNWDRQVPITVDASVANGHPHTFPVVAQYFRLVYTNGDTGQTHFRLQTVLHHARSGPQFVLPAQIVSASDDVQLVRPCSTPALDISRGLVADKIAVRVHGERAGIGTTTNAIEPSNVAAYPWPVAAETLRIRAGGNAADDATGAGARQVTLVFLSATWGIVTEMLATNGISASLATASTGFRLIDAWVSQSGTYSGGNTAAILIENSATNQLLATIPAGYGNAQLSQHTVRAGYTAYLERVSLHVSPAVSGNVRMFSRPNADTFAAPFGGKRLVRSWPGVAGSVEYVFKKKPVFGPLTDLWFEGEATATTTSIGVEYDLTLVLQDNPFAPQ